VRVDALAVTPGAGQVRGQHAGPVAHPGMQAGLLEHLAHHRVARVLTVVEPTTWQRPELVPGDAVGEAAQQDPVVADDDGVRRHPLTLRNHRHGSNLRRVGTLLR
jgi:hypothetical protein